MTSKRPLIVETRKTRQGPEEKLVNWFINNIKFQSPDHIDILCFKEPVLETGFPDLVFVIWANQIAKLWPDDRKMLNTLDVKILHFLSINGPTSECELHQFYKHKYRSSLKRLMSAAVIEENNGEISAKPLSEIYGVIKIISIEAKIGNWKKVLEQAWINTWFSNESYVLIPSKLLERTFEGLQLYSDIGILTDNDDHLDIEILSESSGQPKSYVSWVFNEWAWQFICQ